VREKISCLVFVEKTVSTEAGLRSFTFI